MSSRCVCILNICFCQSADDLNFTFIYLDTEDFHILRYSSDWSVEQEWTVKEDHCRLIIKPLNVHWLMLTVLFEGLQLLFSERRDSESLYELNRKEEHVTQFELIICIYIACQYLRLSLRQVRHWGLTSLCEEETVLLSHAYEGCCTADEQTVFSLLFMLWQSVLSSCELIFSFTQGSFMRQVLCADLQTDVILIVSVADPYQQSCVYRNVFFYLKPCCHLTHCEHDIWTYISFTLNRFQLLVSLTAWCW